MNGHKARLLRNMVYGEETHRQRSYFLDTEHNRTVTTGAGDREETKNVRSGAIIADKKRRIYKHIKKIYTQIRGVSPKQLQSISDGLQL